MPAAPWIALAFARRGGDSDGMTGLILFDDDYPGLAPLTDLRPSFELRTGAMTTAQRLADRLNRPVGAVMVPPGLATLAGMHFDVPVNRLPDGDGSWMMLNGRWTTITAPLPSELNTAMVDADGSVVAALLEPAHAQRFIDTGGELDDAIDVAPMANAELLRRPWDIIRGLDDRLRHDLALLTRGRETFDAGEAQLVAVVGDNPVVVGDNVSLHPFVCLDATDGPIVIGDNVSIHPHSVVYGPCCLGDHTLLHARTDVGGSAVGPRCKLGGEIGGCIIQAYSNKAHAGYLGDSYLGEWVNLGAGTLTSNLKHTYGTVRAKPAADGEPEDTAMQFFGAVIGDHVKTSIGSRLTTGSMLATGAMVALSVFPPKYVDRFAFMTDARRTKLDLDRFALVADRMMQRRGQRVTAELAHRFAQLYGQGS